jgi:penicillin amidase
MRRILARTTVALALLAAVLAAASYAYLRRSLPDARGTRPVVGLHATLEIVRDADNIPHVFAATKRDALFGLGYVHAQDRLWQMEFQRRVGHGRLSEIFGATTLGQDRFLRTIGFGRAARSAWERLPGDARAEIEAYVAGVNAFVAGAPAGALPPEFTLLGIRPEPWTGPDVMVWIKMMAWDLSANYSFELLRHDLVAAVGPARMLQLMPPYPDNGLSIVHEGLLDTRMRRHEGRPPVPAAAVGTAAPASARTGVSWSGALARAVSAGHPDVARVLFGGARSEGLGSNNWVVDGTLTGSGKPLLANDPHLGANIPSLWYLAHLSAPGYEVVGATLPGSPGVAIGRNRHIAWGETNVAADVQDLFRERLDPTGTMALFRGAWEPVRMITEVIGVRRGGPVEVTVRVTRHGPLVSDALNAMAAGSGRRPRREPLEPLALRWTALDEEDTTVVAFLRLNEARNWSEFTRALEWFVVPAQNFVYADVDGHIGYYAPGRIPIRAAGDGSLPAEGWSGEMEWTGWVPFDELPHLYDPPGHLIVTANHRPAPREYQHLIGLEFPNPYRATRILDLLTEKAARRKLTPADFRDIQADTVSLHARDLLPLLLRHVEVDSETERRAVKLLAAWDFDASADSAAAAIFQAWFLRLAPALAGDELGPAVLQAYQGRFTHVTRFVAGVLASEDHDDWCDDVRTAARERCAAPVTAALREGLQQLSERLGPDVTSWRWGAVHRATFPHQGLDAIPLLRRLFSRATASAGDWSTVNVGAVAADRPFEQRSIPGYRQIVDLSPANDSRFLDAVGQSGHVLSPHYDDFLDDWRAVRHRPMRMERADVERGALGTLRLTPK